MSDILEEIQALSDKFSNLFEVDDLGNPAVDVPPSQNKIKRDRKTKDGKVEVVSVEDELFPYEGNKREQYRQKIIDIINNMIQGTATLEDLLQFVRQKKAPLKEAMELMEDIHKMIDKHGDKIGPKSELHDLMRARQYDAAIQYGEEKGKPYEKRWEDEQDFEDRRKGEDTKNYKGQRKTTEKQFKGFGTVTVGGAEPSEIEKKVRREHAKRDGRPVQDYPFDGDLEDYVGNGSKPQKIIDKSIKRHEKKEQKKAPLKEAMELMETALTAIRNSGLPKEKQQELTSKLAKGRAKERELADEKAFKSWAKGDRKQLDVQTVRDPEFTKNASGERKTRLRSHSNNYTKSGGRKIKPEWKQVEDSIKRHEKKAKLAEALSLMEEIINELSPEVVKRAFDKRTDKSLEADEKDRKEFNDILKIKDRDKRAATFKEFKKRSDDRFNKEEKKNDLYFNYALKHPEIIEEALSLMEDIINEVSIGKWKEAAKNSIDKRKEAAENTAKTAEQSWDDYEEGSRKHPEDEDALYKRAWRNDIIAKKAEQKADHASDVLGIKAKGKSANKTIKAAKNSEIKRNDAYLQNTDPEKFDKLRNRMEKTDQLVMTDPVKSRADEALEEALAIINEVSKKFMAPRLEAGAKKAEQIAKRKEEIIADPKRTEKEKDEAAKENAAYQCKAMNVTNDAVKYQEKKQKKNK